MPLRVRLSLLVGAAAALLLTVGGVVFLHQLRDGLDNAVDTALRARADALSSQLVSSSGAGFQDAGAAGLLPPHEALAQLLSPSGSVVDSSEGATGAPLLTPRQVAAAQRNPVSVTSTAAGDSVRLLAVAVPGAGVPAQVLVVGTTRDLSEAALTQARTLLLVAGPLVVLACALGAWLLAGATLRPVTRMRRQADAITAGDVGARLTVPATRDEVALLGATMNALLQRLQTAVAQQRDLVADAGHELRTPLALLRAELELAVRPHRSRHEVDFAVRDALDDIDRLTRLTDDLLLLATAEDARAPAREKPVRLDLLVLEGVEQVRRRQGLAGGSTASIEVQVDARDDREDDRGMTIVADGDEVLRIVINLVENALHHAHGASRVSLRLSTSDGPPMAVLDVTDEGPGFPEAFLPYAFERFRRADPSRSVGQGGVGIGLSIVAALVHHHGGTVSATNGASGGAHVQVRLPRPPTETVDA
ncbi:ATP-binding protein [Dermatophilaceae bacterium Soc4.6]